MYHKIRDVVETGEKSDPVYSGQIANLYGHAGFNETLRRSIARVNADLIGMNPETPNFAQEYMSKQQERDVYQTLLIIFNYGDT